MKVKIEYEYKLGCYLASTTINDKFLCKASDTSYEDAKLGLIDQIKEIKKTQEAPEPEEVEI